MLLLDTCAVIWLAEGGKQLSAVARRAIREQAGALHVSAITAFEVAFLERKKRLELPEQAGKWYAEVLDVHGLHEVPISGAIASISASLPRLHDDPCDRFILATALVCNLGIVTADRMMEKYPRVSIVW